MMSLEFLKDLDKRLKFIRNRDEPFGGVAILLFGDLFQMPAISEKNCYATLSNTHLTVAHEGQLLYRSFKPIIMS